MFFTSPLISHFWYFFTRQLICFFHLALIFFFSSKSCGFQSDCLRCCLSDGLRCFAFRWLRGKAKCCVLQKTLVELESKRGIGDRESKQLGIAFGIGSRESGSHGSRSGIGNRESKQLGNQSGIGNRESKQLGTQSGIGDRGPKLYLESVSHFWLGFETGFRTRLRF